MSQFAGDFGIEKRDDHHSMVAEVSNDHLSYTIIRALLMLIKQAKLREKTDFLHIFYEEGAGVFYIFAFCHTATHGELEIKQIFAELRLCIRRAGIMLHPAPCEIEVPPALLAGQPGKTHYIRAAA